MSKSYRQILKSSALIGGSSVLSLVFRTIRTKAVALVLGPTGVGLFGLYGSIVDLTLTLCGLGVNNSGVRQIAEAAGTGDAKHVARTVITLRRVALVSGTLGAGILFFLRKPVAQLTFGDTARADSVALLALAVLFGNISSAQGALVQGMRRISDLARLNVWGALCGMLIGIPLVYVYGEHGVVPSLVCVAAVSLFTSWWYARKIKIESIRISFGEFVVESSALLKLGVVFVVSGLLFMGSEYLTKVIVLQKLGTEAAGFYQAAWALGGFYAGFILNAMGADFYPRLTAVADDHPECNRLVNEQITVGLLLAVPGAIGTLAYAPVVIELFYSGKFGPSVEMLRWICLGMALRVASWPMAFILVAKSKGKIYLCSEAFYYVLLVFLVWVGVHFFGLNGAGIGFFGMHCVHLIGSYVIVRRLTGFRWSAANRRLGLLFVPLLAVVFSTWYVLPRVAALIVGTAGTALCGIYSVRKLGSLIPIERFPKAAQKILGFLRLLPRNPIAGE